MATSITETPEFKALEKMIAAKVKKFQETSTEDKLFDYRLGIKVGLEIARDVLLSPNVYLNMEVE